jgi:hypothetical protein
MDALRQPDVPPVTPATSACRKRADALLPRLRFGLVLRMARPDFNGLAGVGSRRAGLNKK